MKQTACVIGAGPNGLAAAIVLAQAGLEVEVVEAAASAGGAARTMELTLPGFRHDFGSAVYPLGAGSPFFSLLPLSDYGFEWIHSPAPAAHPLDDGTAVVLERDLSEASAALGADGDLWRDLVEPFVKRWRDFAGEVLGPMPPVPKHPFLMAHFALNAFRSARAIASRFSTERTRALFAGMAAHSLLSLDEPLSGAFGTLMAVPAHAVGWPVPKGGAQSLSNALSDHLRKLGGKIKTSSPVERLGDLGSRDLFVFDVTPRQLLQIAGERLSRRFQLKLGHFRYGSGVFKVDFALSRPIPWRSPECLRAATVHIGGSFEEIAASEKAVRSGQIHERPFVLLAQPSLFDATRAPAGKHTAWAYCHVPNGSTTDMQPRIEEQIERFAPGFRECILARRALSPADLERLDSNLVGGDIGGGALDLGQFLFRPTWRRYGTSAGNIFICSSSTPPGGGVHGMCGYHAARAALARLGSKL
ncbi:MAG: NAD(P)/FAD-dependent oxidoreductase [Acidobacteria bacterium]|nr:NAD(P)/FAD-dependent oxidoreductase [Acidobacteriota bacterium]